MNFNASRSSLGGVASRKRPSQLHGPRARRAHVLINDENRRGFGESENNDLQNRYPHPIQFYDQLPGAEIGLIDFESLALERLKVLRVMEKVASLNVMKHSKEWADKIDSELKQGNPSSLASYSYSGLENSKECMINREKDHFSHFILRLAYCKSEELRRWFITQECDLFRYRCMMAGSLKDFIEFNDLNYIIVPQEELNDLRSVLHGLLFKSNSRESPSTFYKVPFTEALDLVRSRKVFLRNGMCYVPDTEVISLVSHIFKPLLTQGLIYTYKVLPNLDEDERLMKVLGDLDRRYTGADYNSNDNGNTVKPDMIKPLSEKNFPLCMKAMQFELNKNHHLKYRARLQYGLFLKGIGLSLEDAIKFFRGEFTKSHVDADKFDKEYTYGIRYNYGKEGKKVNWAPWNCMRIIMDTVGPGECHGCPYRHIDHDKLRELLVKSGMEGEDLKEIMQLSKDGHYQKACATQFKISHSGNELSTGMMTNHPNQFYMESTNGGINQPISKVKTEKGQIFMKTETQNTEEEK